MLKLLVSIVLIVLITACSPRYPLGISEERWFSMTAEQQNAAIHQQAEIDHAREVERKRKRAEAERLKQQRLAEKKQRIDTRYQKAAYMSCIIKDGKVKLGGMFRPYHPVSFIIVEEESKHLVFETTYQGQKVHVKTNFTFNRFNQTLNFCLRHRCRTIDMSLSGSNTPSYHGTHSLHRIFENVNVSCFAGPGL